MEPDVETSASTEYATDLLEQLLDATREGHLTWRNVFFGKKYTAMNRTSRHCSYVLDRDGLQIAGTDGKPIRSLDIARAQGTVEYLDELEALVKKQAAPWRAPTQDAVDLHHGIVILDSETPHTSTGAVELRDGVLARMRHPIQHGNRR